MKKIKVGIIGLGTVGSGVFNILQNNRVLIEKRCSCEIELAKVADPNVHENRNIELGDVVVATAEEIINDPDIDVIVELVGGTGIAKEFVLKALASKKHVVTANKALLATYGDQIFAKAEKFQVEVGFEAAVAGGIPVIKALKEGLCANNIESIYGIINGTSNFILTKMAQEGKDFNEVLKEAQQNGFAEADPTFDIEGVDAAHKLLLLVNLAFGSKVKLEDIYSEGITRITPMDIEFAREFNYTIKPLVIAKAVGDELEVRVHPTMIPDDYLLANVNGVFNAVFISGDFVGDTLFYGKGAGMDATASAVVADVVDVARNSAAGSSGRARVPVLGYNEQDRCNVRVKPIGEIEGVYYLRFMVTDKPGVLSKISGLFGKYGISMSKVIQKTRNVNEPVPLVIVTHKAMEKNIRLALDEVAKLGVSNMDPVMIRVEGEEL